MENLQLINALSAHGVIVRESHVVYRNGTHGRLFVSFWPIAGRMPFWLAMGSALARLLSTHNVDIVLGPSELGRELAYGTALRLTHGNRIWCEITEDERGKRAHFPRKSAFGELVRGKKVAIVDPLLTGGRSINAMTKLVNRNGGRVVAAGVAIRRTPDIRERECNVPALYVLSELDGLVVYQEAECKMIGPCSEGVPIDFRSRHSQQWHNRNKDYPVLSFA